MRNRGKHPKDLGSFDAKGIKKLQTAIVDAIYLLEKAYTQKSIWQLVGNRYRLNERQRKALMRMACSDTQRAERLSKVLSHQQLQGETLFIDGYNIIISLECAYSNAILLKGHDTCIRDIASLHGTYKSVQATETVLNQMIAFQKAAGLKKIHWYFDKPVSNSGKLKQFLLEKAKENKVDWSVELVNDPDAILKETEGIIATADAVILDCCKQWFNLTSFLLVEMDYPDLPKPVEIILSSQ